LTISSSDHALETFRSLITIALEALKILVLLNGGAVVALLAYLGQIHDRQDLAAAAGRPIGWFIVGLICAAAAFVGSYLTQLALYGESVHKMPQRHQIVLWISIAVSVASLVCFSLGAFSALNAFTGRQGTWV
jgi:hypothetical protein